MDERHSKLAPDLIAAYKNTLFQAHVGDDVITLKVGERCEALGSLFTGHSVTSACYITAYNPFGRLLTPQENDERNNSLKAEVSLIYPTDEGVGVDPKGEWEGEASLLVMGCSEDVSHDLGVKWEQNAVVFVGANLTPRLLFLV